MNPPCCSQAEESVSGLKPVEGWVTHFRDNVRQEWKIPWGSDVRLPEKVCARIASSIAEFQRGESSEALHYLAKSQRFAAESREPAFHDASILFVREENAHAGLLLRFMREVGIPQRKKVFADGVFRRLRAFSDLGWSSRVLMIAELIAQDYYPSLREATAHPALRRICEKIICDEDAHIRFQVERIVSLEREKGAAILALREALQTVLMAGVACVVWLGHHRVLAARMNFGGFLRSALARNRGTIASMRALRSALAAKFTCPRIARIAN